MFIDTHAHLFKEYYDDVESVIKKSLEMGTSLIINSGVDDISNREIIDSISKYECVKGTLGIHPEYADTYKNDDISFIEDNISNKNIVAIGEIGLDYHYDNYNKEKEIEIFEKQLKLAEKYNMPVVVHSRDAGMDTLNILKKYNLKGVIHAFSGSYEMAKEYIKLGYKLGVGGVITFKNAHIKDVIKSVGLDNIVLETDAPYLSPEPLRGTQNISGNICYVIDFLSNLFDISKDEIMSICMSNTKAVFDKL